MTFECNIQIEFSLQIRNQRYKITKKKFFSYKLLPVLLILVNKTTSNSDFRNFKVKLHKIKYFF